MSGRAISILSAVLTNVRVLGELTFVPHHFLNGKEINARTTIPVMGNQKRGGNEKKVTLNLTAWGKLAETCAKSLPKGKSIDVRVELASFDKKLFRWDGTQAQPLLDATGVQVIAKNFVGFTIREICFGEESAEQIAKDIQGGKRPVNWNIVGHPDYQMWLDHLKRRQALAYDPNQYPHGSTFGFARVHIPNGAQLAPAGQPAQAAATGQTMVSYAGQFPQAVEQAVNAQPAPQAAAPVYQSGGVQAAPAQMDLF